MTLEGDPNDMPQTYTMVETVWGKRGIHTVHEGTAGKGKRQMWKLLERKGRASLAGEGAHTPWSRVWPPPEKLAQERDHVGEKQH